VWTHLQTEDMTKEFAGFVAGEQRELRVKRAHPCADRPERRRQDHLLQSLTKFLHRRAAASRSTGRAHHSAAPTDIARLGLVRRSNLGRIPAFYAAQNGAYRLATQTGVHSIFWNQNGCCRPTTNARWRCSRCGWRNSPSDRGRIALWRKRALELATTIGSIPRCCCSMNRPPAWAMRTITTASPPDQVVAVNRTVLMVEHNLSGVSNLSIASRCSRAAGAGGRRLRHGSDNPRCAEAYMGGGMPDDPAHRCSRSRICKPGTASPTSCMRHVRCARRRGGDAARPQRRRQDHDAQIDHGESSASAPIGAPRGRGTH